MDSVSTAKFQSKLRNRPSAFHFRSVEPELGLQLAPDGAAPSPFHQQRYGQVQRESVFSSTESALTNVACSGTPNRLVPGFGPVGRPIASSLSHVACLAVQNDFGFSGPISG